MSRRPGPPPKEPASRVRRNADAVTGVATKPEPKAPTRARRSTSQDQIPVVGSDGWVTIPPGARTGAAPKLPDWLPTGDRSPLVYAELAKLPQAKVWLESEWKLLQLALPLLERYLSRPGSESFKALVTALSPSLKLTTDDLAKARMRIAKVEAEQPAPTASTTVTNIASRRARLTG